MAVGGVQHRSKIYHFIDDASGLGNSTALEAGMGQIVDQFGHCDVAALETIKVDTLHFLSPFGNGLGGQQDRVGRGGGGCGDRLSAHGVKNEGGQMGGRRKENSRVRQQENCLVRVPATVELYKM